MATVIALDAGAAIVQPYQSANWEYSTDNGATWSAGTAGFGSGGYAGVNTYWASGTTMLVKTDIDLTGYDPASAAYALGIDNDLLLYVNGTEIRSIVHDGWANPGDFSGPLTGAKAGVNVIELAITDRGGPDYFDMQITANVAPVPEPTTVVAGLGAVGLVLAGLHSRRCSPVRLGQ